MVELGHDHEPSAAGDAATDDVGRHQAIAAARVVDLDHPVRERGLPGTAAERPFRIENGRASREAVRKSVSTGFSEG